MNKRGFNLSMEGLFDLFIIAIIFIAGIYFISDNSSGKMIEKQLIAKELCIFVNSIEDNSILTLQTNLIIEKSEKEIFVKSSKIDYGYRYPCVLSPKVSIQQYDNKLEIKKQ